MCIFQLKLFKILIKRQKVPKNIFSRKFCLLDFSEPFIQNTSLKKCSAQGSLLSSQVYFDMDVTCTQTMLPTKCAAQRLSWLQFNQTGGTDICTPPCWDCVANLMNWFHSQHSSQAPGTKQNTGLGFLHSGMSPNEVVQHLHQAKDALEQQLSIYWDLLLLPICLHFSQAMV